MKIIIVYLRKIRKRGRKELERIRIRGYIIRKERRSGQGDRRNSKKTQG